MGATNHVITASPMQRLIAEWLTERARFMGSLVGLTDEQSTARRRPVSGPTGWLPSHVLAVEQDSLKDDRGGRAARGGQGVLE